MANESNDEELNQWMKTLNLKPHNEGGFYAETNRSTDQCAPARFNQQTRSCATTIYYLLRLPDSPKSIFHRIKADEMWHFYQGLPLTIHVLDEEDSSHSEFVLHNQLELNSSARPQILVPYGKWFGAEILPTAMKGQTRSYTLCGCVCAPGFEYEDFECAERSYLIAKFPKFKELITRLTPEE